MGLLSPAAKANLATGLVHLGFLAELEFRTGTERYWSGIAPLNFEGRVWHPTGKFGGVSEMASTEDFRANGLTLAMAGLPGDAFADLSALSASDYKGRRARFIVALMDSTFTNVVHAIPRYYFIDTLDYTVDPELGSAASVNLETETRRASRAKVRRYTNQDQERIFAGDRAFEFVSYLASGIEVKWGSAGAFYPPT